MTDAWGRDRRRYAAMETCPRRDGGVAFFATLFGCHPDTSRMGASDIQRTPVRYNGNRDSTGVSFHSPHTLECSIVPFNSRCDLSAGPDGGIPHCRRVGVARRLAYAVRQPNRYRICSTEFERPKMPVLPEPEPPSQSNHCGRREAQIGIRLGCDTPIIGKPIWDERPLQDSGPFKTAALTRWMIRPEPGRGMTSKPEKRPIGNPSMRGNHRMGANPKDSIPFGLFPLPA